MANHDYSGVNEFPHFDRITLTNADEADTITPPGGSCLLSVGPITNACRVSHAGTGGAQITDNYRTCPGDSLTEFHASAKQPITTWYIDSGSAGTVVEIVIERPV